MTVSTRGIVGAVEVTNFCSDLTAYGENPAGAISHIVLNSQKGDVFVKSGDILDNTTTKVSGFNAAAKLALVSSGAGVQKLTGSSMEFSGGVTAKSGTLLVNGLAAGSSNITYTHGILSMEGGTFGIYHGEGAGVFTFSEAYWKSGTIILGTYTTGADLIKITGSFNAGEGTVSLVHFEFDALADTDYIGIIDAEACILSAADFEESFNVDSFSADNITVSGIEYSAKFRFDRDNGNVYMQYVAVPEPSTIAALIEDCLPFVWQSRNVAENSFRATQKSGV